MREELELVSVQMTVEDEGVSNVITASFSRTEAEAMQRAILERGSIPFDASPKRPYSAVLAVTKAKIINIVIGDVIMKRPHK